jgi:predicted transcriptional regulator
VTEITRVYSLLHNELKRVDADKIDVDTLYHLDKETGEMVPVAEVYPVEASKIIQSIRKSSNKTLGFISLWQKAQLQLIQNLSGGSIKVLLYMLSNMKYHNLVFDATQKNISESLNMSSRTVIRALKELDDKGVVKYSKKNNIRTYHVNPAYAWKGSFMQIKYSMSIFKEDMQEHKALWKK